MLRKIAFAGCLLLLITACVADREAEYEIATLVLPNGHPDAGRDAFMQLGCASCHKVEWEPGLPDPPSTTLGPELGRTLRMQTAGGVATSILVPSHHVPSKVREATGSELSPMGDFSETMTTRQLIDIVSYLRKQGAETVASVEFDREMLPSSL